MEEHAHEYHLLAPHFDPKHPGAVPQLPLIWHAHEYEHRHRSSDWYWGLGVVAVVGAVGALLINDILFALIIVLGALILGMFWAREPEVVEFEISRRGIRINDDLYPYQNLAGFWIEDISHLHIPKLLIKPKKFYQSIHVITLEGVEPEDVYVALLYFLPEEELHEPIAHKIIELIER